MSKARVLRNLLSNVPERIVRDGSGEARRPLKGIELQYKADLSGVPFDPRVTPAARKILRVAEEQANLPPSQRIKPTGDSFLDMSPGAYQSTQGVMPQSDLRSAIPHPGQGYKLPKRERAAQLQDPRLRNDIAEELARRAQPYMGGEAENFYHVGPIYDSLRSGRGGFGHQEAVDAIQRFAQPLAGTSPRTETMQNFKNGSLLNMMQTNGIGVHGSPRMTNRQGVNMPGYPMMGVHRDLTERLTGNVDTLANNPKPTMFARNVAGDLSAGSTVDTHNIRGVIDAWNTVRPGEVPPGWLKPAEREHYLRTGEFNPATSIDDKLGGVKARPMRPGDLGPVDARVRAPVGQSGRPEYGVIDDINRDVGQLMGVPPADAQALGWFGSGDRTGLMSQLKSIPGLTNDAIDKTAQVLGIEPEMVMKMVFKGYIPVLSTLTAVIGASGAEREAVGPQNALTQPGAAPDA